MPESLHVTAHVPGPKGYRLVGAVQNTAVRAVRFGRKKSPLRTASAILFAFGLAGVLWALIAAGWLIFD